MRILSDLLCRDLVCRHTGKSILALCGFRTDATEPGRGTQRMDSRCICGGMRKAADNVDLVSEGFERFQDWRELKTGSFLLRRPLVHDRAMRKVDERKARRHIRSRLTLGGQRRDHGIQERQREGDAGAP